MKNTTIIKLDILRLNTKDKDIKSVLESPDFYNEVHECAEELTACFPDKPLRFWEMAIIEWVINKEPTYQLDDLELDIKNAEAFITFNSHARI